MYVDRILPFFDPPLLAWTGFLPWAWTLIDNFWPPPPSSCPRSYWMAPNDFSSFNLLTYQLYKKVISIFSPFLQTNETEKHLSSSIEDLKLLFQAEKEFVETLKRNHSLFINDAKFAYLEAVDFKPNEAAYYVYHPINAFHMLLRLL